jgi:hypothetical protein
MIRRAAKVSMIDYVMEEDYQKIGKGIEKLFGPYPITSSIVEIEGLLPTKTIINDVYHKNGVTICVEEKHITENRDRVEWNFAKINFYVESDLSPIDRIVGKILDLDWNNFEVDYNYDFKKQSKKFYLKRYAPLTIK